MAKYGECPFCGNRTHNYVCTHLTSLTPELREVAEQALCRMKVREFEDIDESAKTLAAFVVDLDD